jgi:hypothetical protein
LIDKGQNPGQLFDKVIDLVRLDSESGELAELVDVFELQSHVA